MLLNKIKDRLEIATNILVLVMGVALISFFVYKNFYPKTKTMEAKTLNTGSLFHGLEEIDFKNHPNTLIIALSTRCPYCTASLPFYKRLIETNKNSEDLRIIGIFPQPQDEIDRYLAEHNLQIHSIPNVKLGDINIEATPTVVWIDNKKKIVRSWEGFFEKDAEDDYWDFYNAKLVPK